MAIGLETSASAPVKVPVKVGAVQWHIATYWIVRLGVAVRHHGNSAAGGSGKFWHLGISATKK